MGLSRGVKGCIGKYLAAELLMKCYGCRFFGVAVWWRYLLNSSYTLVLERLGPKVSGLKEGDAIAHHGIRRQLDLLGYNLLELQLSAFERQAQFERARKL